MAKAGLKDGQLIVDFSDVESGGGRVRVPEDDYRVKVKGVKQETAKSSGNPMLVWDFEIVDGKFAGKVLRDRTVLQDNSLWKLKGLLEAMGVEVPSKRVALRLKGYIGKELGVTTTDDEYEGKISSKISDYVDVNVLDGADEDVEDEDEDEDVEEEPKPKAKKGKKGKKAKKQQDEEEIEDLDLDEI